MIGHCWENPSREGKGKAAEALVLDLVPRGGCGVARLQRTSLVACGFKWRFELMCVNASVFMYIHGYMCAHAYWSRNNIGPH